MPMCDYNYLDCGKESLIVVTLKEHERGEVLCQACGSKKLQQQEYQRSLQSLSSLPVTPKSSIGRFIGSSGFWDCGLRELRSSAVHRDLRFILLHRPTILWYSETGIGPDHKHHAEGDDHEDASHCLWEEV